MQIEGRIDKPYSKSLFNQLFLLAMLIQSENQLPVYIIDSKIHKSDRTYRRYFQDLNQAGLIPKIQRRRKDNSYTVPFDFRDMKRFTTIYGGKRYVDIKGALLHFLSSYIEEHCNTRSRLYRCGRVMISSFNNCYWDNSYYFEDDGNDDELDLTDIDMTDMVIFKNEFYHIAFTGYENLYKDLSIRSRQRDFKLLKDVFLTILTDHDTFG